MSWSQVSNFTFSHLLTWPHLPLISHTCTHSPHQAHLFLVSSSPVKARAHPSQGETGECNHSFSPPTKTLLHAVSTRKCSHLADSCGIKGKYLRHQSETGPVGRPGPGFPAISCTTLGAQHSLGTIAHQIPLYWKPQWEPPGPHPK